MGARASGAGVQTRREGLAEITSGRACAQQGLTATCKDLLCEAIAEAGGRAKPATPSARALRGTGRRHRPGRRTLDRLSPRFLPARAGALTAVPRLFLAQLRHAFDTGALHFYRQLEP